MLGFRAKGHRVDHPHFLPDFPDFLPFGKAPEYGTVSFPETCGQTPGRADFQLGVEGERNLRALLIDHGCPFPKLDRTVTPGGKGLSVRRKGKRVDDIQMSGILLAVKPELGKRRIGQIHRFLFPCTQVIKMDAVAPPCDGKPAAPVHRSGVNGWKFTLIGLPGDRQTCLQGSLRSLIDPELKQAKFGRSQVLGSDFVLGWRHDRFVGMGGELEKKALLRIARLHERTSFIALSDVIGGFHDDLPLGTRTVMASQAIGPEHWENLFLEINRFVSLDLSDFKFPP